MVLRRGFALFTIILIVALLGACVRSASTPPVNVVTPPVEEGSAAAPDETTKGEAPAAEGAPAEASPESAGAADSAAPTNEVMAQLELFVTQTAAAAQVSGGQPPAEQPSGAAPVATEVPATGPSSAPPTATTVAVEQPTVPAASQPVQQPTVPASGQPTAVPQPQQPAPPGQIVVPTATPGIPSTYTVQTSEFAYCIARRFDVNPYELLSINGLNQNSVLKAGMVLKMPKTGHPFPGQRALLDHPTTYVVKSGENIYAIACKFGDIGPDMIALANSLKAPFTLTAGQELYIP